MAFSGAIILNFDAGEIKRVSYEELESVRLIRDFLQNPEAFIDRL